jgi:hypothetical protein
LFTALLQNQLASTSDPTLPAATVLASASLRLLQDLTLFYMFQTQAAAK